MRKKPEAIVPAFLRVARIDLRLRGAAMAEAGTLITMRAVVFSGGGGFRDGGRDGRTGLRRRLGTGAGRVRPALSLRRRRRRRRNACGQRVFSRAPFRRFDAGLVSVGVAGRIAGACQFNSEDRAEVVAAKRRILPPPRVCSRLLAATAWVMSSR